jgi:DNA invertase Pin-like site-specific DNA recombinase
MPKGRKVPPKGTAVAYCRFSCAKQREASIADQLRVCTEWCTAHGYTIVKKYTDYAQSGRSDDRPEFQRMIANAGESEIVIVYASDRFSRSAYDAPIYKKKLEDHGTRVVSATENVPDGPEAILIEKVYEGLAAVESAHIAIRTRRGMEGNALKCRHNGVTVFGYDFGDDGSYVVDEAEAAIVREIFRRRIDHETINSIATDLARRGYTTQKGNPCNDTMVKCVIRNEKYKGVYTWGGVRVEDGMPAIVSKETWEMAQRVRSHKVRATEEWRDFAFAGKGVCLGCGMNLVGVSGRGNHNKKYDYYRCADKCGCKPIRADWLENAVTDELRRMLSSRETALEVARAVASIVSDKETEALLKAASNRLSEAQRGISNILRAVESGMDYDDVKDRLSELKLQKAQAEAEVAKLETVSKIDVEQFADFLQLGATLTDRKLLDAFVWQVQVSDDRVIVVLNYDIKEEPARMVFTRGFEETVCGSPDSPFFELFGARVICVGGVIMLEIPRTA